MARSAMNAPIVMRRAAQDAFRNRIARTRLDYQRDGSHLKAILTVTLPNGQTYRFERSCDLDVLLAVTVNNMKGGNKVGGLIAIAGDPLGFVKWRDRVAIPKQKSGEWDKDRVKAEVASAMKRYGMHKSKGFFGELGRAGKGVVTSGVFKAAAQALATIGPVLPPPIGTAAMAAGGAMLGVRALVAGKAHLKAGNVAAAKKLVKYAAKKVPRAMQPAVRAQADRVYALMLKPA